jgi:PAS domain S-box-containing protein
VAPTYHILYVDDEPGLLEVGKLFLEQSGQFSVDTIASATDAFALLNSKIYDAIVSDYQMPGMDGIEFLKTVRTSGNTIPFILFTGRGREEVVIQAINSGADFYLQKGGDPKAQFAELEHKIRQAVQKHLAEASIRDLEREQADIINFLPDATFAIDNKGVVIAWNHSMEEMTGVAAAEILGKGNYEYAIPGYHERQPVLIDLVLHEDPDLEAKYPLLKRDGRTLTAETTSPFLYNGRGATIWIIATPLYNTQGTLIGAIQSIRDITDQRHFEEELLKKNKEIHASYEQIAAAEKELGANLDELTRKELELRKSEEKYRSVIDNIQDMFYRSDLAGNLIMASPSCLRTLGYESFDDILNKPISETFYFSPEKREELLRILTENGSIADYEVQLKCRDGTPLWVSTYSHYYRDENGTIAGIEGIFRDITRHRADEDALKRDAAQLKQIIDLVPHMIFAKDWNGNYLLANRAVAEGYNTTVAGIVGKPQARFHGDTAELRHMLEDDREVMTTGTTKFIPEEPYIDAFGKQHILQTTKVPFTTLGNNQQAVLGVAIDITEHKRVEEELLKKNEELNASYEQITAAEEELRSSFDALTLREQALKESEERYRNVVEDQTEFISRCLPDSTHVFVNDAYCRYFGLKSDEILGHRFRPRIPGEDRDRVKQFFASLTPDHPVDVIEHRIIMPDGTIRWQRWSDRAIFDPSGKVTEYQSVGQDITDRKLEEQALHENEQRLTSIYNTVGDVIFQLTVEPHEQYRFTSVNSTFSRITGLPSEQVIGMKVNEIIPEPSLSMVLEKYRQAIEEKAIVRWEETSNYPSGQLIGEVSIAPIFDNANTCTHLIGSVHDITERKRSENALRESERRYRFLAECMKDVVWQMDADMTFTYVSPSVLHQCGFTPEEVVGKRLFDFITPASEKNVRCQMAKRIEQNPGRFFRGSATYLLEQVCRGGSTLMTEVVTNTVFDEEERFMGWRGITRDISERKLSEEALRLANRKLKLLSGITRHDINNQVTVLQSYIALLDMKQSDPSYKKYLLEAETAAQRISAMIRFTKEYELIGVNAPVWQECRKLIETAAKQARLGNVTVKNDIPAKTELFADPLIVKVFYNLMDNAVQHGGTITTMRFSAQESGADHLIVCEDDGYGIPADVKEKIFDRGFGKNTGLGLFLSREILSITGIRIRETGEPGKGARFEIIVPQGSFRL